MTPIEPVAPAPVAAEAHPADPSWAVLWDLDGTLMDSEPHWFAVEREIVESFGGSWSDEQAHHVIGFDLLDSARFILGETGLPLSPRELVERMIDGVIERLRRDIPWRPGAPRLLSELNAAGVPCGLVTMSWRRLVEPVLAALPNGAFAVVITGDEVPPGSGKPGPTPYQLAAAACGLAPAACVAIEDSPTGVASALSAGCAVVAVPHHRSLDDAAGVHVLSSLTDVAVGDLRSIADACR